MTRVQESSLYSKFMISVILPLTCYSRKFYLYCYYYFVVVVVVVDVIAIVVVFVVVRVVVTNEDVML